MKWVEVSTQVELDALAAGVGAIVRSGVFYASGSATVHAWGSATVRAWGSATVHATPWVAVHHHSTAATAIGGTLIDATAIDTPERWLVYHGVPAVDGKAVLAKAIDDDWKGTYKVPRLLYRPGRTVKVPRLLYRPGRTVTAPDWDPTPQCGGGLHLSPCPAMALAYHPTATKFVAVEVDVTDIVVIGDKCKVPTCRALYEVDIDGNRKAD